MPEISLNNCFPEPPTGSLIERGPLPKQALFLNLSLQDNNPKYLRYVGGIGSGKSLIGCVTMLAWAVMYPGDYLIARQFMPELRATTYKTFLELCPKELIVEHRVADAIIKLRSNGGTSTIMFRPLEDPDKHRSLNLNAFYIDEANQCTEAAFVLLQGRLRGRHVRKGILTQNSGGHDWSWRWFVKQDMFKSEKAKKLFVNIKAPSTENTHLPDGYVEAMLETWTDERIQREIYANEDSFEGMVYHEFRYDTHVVQPFAIPKEWTKVAGADHGYRNPAAWIWGAMDPDGCIYIYREFYEREWDVEEICLGKKDDRGNRMPTMPGIVERMTNQGTGQVERLEMAVMDPSVGGKRGQERTEWDDYLDYLPEGFPLMKGNNSVEAGIDRVKQYLKIDKRLKKPRLFIFNNCINLLDEIAKYRYAEIPVSRQGKVNEKERPSKVDDHACDALRYLIMTRPEPAQLEMDWYEKHNVKYNSSAGGLHRHLESMREPEEVDPFEGDY